MKDVIMSGSADKMAVIFFGSKTAKNDNGSPGVFVYRDLQEPDAVVIKEISKLSTPATFREEIGTEVAATKFSEALWTCMTVHNKNKGSKFDKRIFIFTNRNDPTESKGDRERAEQKKNDLTENGISIELFPFNRDFSPYAFWKDMVEIADDEDLSAYVAVKLENIQEHVRRRAFKKRALGSVDLTIGPTDDEGKCVRVAVKLFCQLKQAKKDTPITLGARDNKILTCQTRWVCASTGEHLQAARPCEAVSDGPGSRTR